MAGAAAPAANQGEPKNRAIITVSIMMATLMNSLDTTIANVALPHIQGSVSASQDQITWVLTSYIVAAAIMTPLTGWLAGEFGRKRIFMISIFGFTVASALCGISNSLVEIVLFRLLQGAFGAALVPLSQAVLLDINPPEKHGQAMAVWGAGAILGPVLGPALGGWLTDNLSWRWVFYINLPIGVLTFLGVFLFIQDHKQDVSRKFDFFGFGTLAVAIGAFQLFLDRGETLAWFSSTEVQIEALVAVVALYLFIVQIATAKKPFIDAAILADRNFVTASVFGFFVGILLFATLALLPPMMENLMGYSVVLTGIVSMPRGLGSFASMFIVGQLVSRVDLRLILFTGLTLSAVALVGMSHFTIVMGSAPIVITGFLQGLGIGLIFVPLSTLAFASLPIRVRTEAAGFYTLVRTIGSSAGISILTALLSRNSSISHSDLIQHVRPDNPALATAHLGPQFNLQSTQGLLAFNGLVTQQSAMVAYVDDFRLMLWITLAVMPLLILMRPPKRPPKTRGAAQAKPAIDHAAYE